MAACKLRGLVLWVAAIFALCLGGHSVIGIKTFTIEENRFLLDGEPVQLISGSIHYSRIHPAYWFDRLWRAKAMGLNTIQFYVPWNLHEPSPGEYTWEGMADLEQWLTLLKDLNFLVLLRPGPYICAEWDFGGFPWWLASSKVEGGGEMMLRSDDPNFLLHVEKWWEVLFHKVSPFLFSNGGTIVMVQVENEYGFCAPSRGTERAHKYLRELIRIAHEGLGEDVILYTTDPPSVAAAGTLQGDEVFTAVDFGAGWYQLDKAFGIQASFNPPGKSAPICTEYYTGWITKWGDAMTNTSADKMVEWLGYILDYANSSGSVSFYMAHGGTNFGFWPGAADGNEGYHPDITSYDYDCMISEAGAYGQPGIGGPSKYHMVREVLLKRAKAWVPSIPKPAPTAAYGSTNLTTASHLLSAASALAELEGVHQSEYPAIMEEYGQGWGVILYRTKVNSSWLASSTELHVKIHDFGKVFIDSKLVASLDRNVKGAVVIPACAPTSGDAVSLDVLVYEMGRDNNGCYYDFKGIVKPNVTLDGKTLTGWTVVPMKLNDIPLLQSILQSHDTTRSTKLPVGPMASNESPAFFRGVLNIAPGAFQRDSVAGQLPSTFLSTPGWTRGMAWVNGFNLGWYWPVKGPQNTLYVPGAVLKEGDNDIFLMELDGAPGVPQVDFLDTPHFSAQPTPPRITATGPHGMQRDHMAAHVTPPGSWHLPQRASSSHNTGGEELGAQ